MNKTFINKYNVINEKMDIDTPLTIGNGNFAFTCDITGLQTFYDKYQTTPLCTMTNLIWAGQEVDLPLPYQEYQKSSNGQKILYMSDTKSPYYQPHRANYFKFDLFKLALLADDKPINPEDLSQIHQELNIFEGTITSSFTYANEKVKIITKIPQKHNNLRINIETNLTNLKIKLFFLEPASNIAGGNDITFKYLIDNTKIIRKDQFTSYELFYQTNMIRIANTFLIQNNSFLIIAIDNYFEDDHDLAVYFSKVKKPQINDEELTRRFVLSLYLMKVNTLGIYPPAETGLTCNSWYGKFHLEMHLWHHLGLIKLGLYEYVLPSLKWYLTIYESSQKRAQEQGYQGIRLPKMVDYRGVDSPSNIGCFLIWQMPHLLIMLEEIYKQTKDTKLIEPFIPFVSEQIKFLESFFYLKDNYYHLDSPLIPANENVEYYQDTPIFELAYSLYAFEIFKKWINRFEINYDTSVLDDILNRHLPLPIYKGAYENYNNCHNTYTKYNYDHPMITGFYSFFKSKYVNPKIMQNTLNKVLKHWKLNECWGWDFPMLAMTASNLGNKELAINILKMKTPKNTYLKNGHNQQKERQDLPLYLPGNGALLLAISHLFKS